MQILIVEDEFITRSTLERSLKRMGYGVSGQAASASDALEILKEGNTELAILDINIEGEQDGIWVANHIRENYQIPFVFLTAYGDEKTVERAMAAEPHGYLMKPFETVDIFTAVRTALTNFTARSGQAVTEPPTEEPDRIISQDNMFIREGHLFTKLEFKDIHYLKAEGNYVAICTNSKKHLARGTMKDFSERLPLDTFFRTQKSYIVNLKNLESIGPKFIVLASGEEVPLSERARPELMAKLNM